MCNIDYQLSQVILLLLPIRTLSLKNIFISRNSQLNIITNKKYHISNKDMHLLNSLSLYQCSSINVNCANCTAL